MEDFNLEEEGIEVQALLDKVQTPDSAPTQNSSSLVTSGGVYEALRQKQQKLTFDLVPIEGSNNPVKSDGIYFFVRQNVAEQIEDLQPIVIEGNVDNAPDEEDLTSVDQSGTDVLKFKNKAYAPLVFSGKGRTYLRKNITGGKNVLTSAMIADSNTIYHIQYDYDLNEQTLTIPAGCVLQFDGGSISNGTLVGNGSSIIAPDIQIFDDITFDGTFNGNLNAMWVGAKPNDSAFDNSDILQSWLDSYSDFFSVIDWPLNTYYFLSPAIKNDTDRFKEIRGNNSIFRVNIPDNNGEGQFFLSIQGENFTIRDVRIVNTRTTISGSTTYDLSKTKCLLLNKAQLFSISGITIQYFDVGVHIIDVWYGGFSGVNSIFGCRVCVLATGVSSSEVNTIDFHNVRCRGVVVAAASALWPQNEGESNDDYAMRIASVGLDFHLITNNCKFDSITMEGFDYGIRFNWKPRASNANMQGVASIEKCYFEANRTYDIYVGKGYVINPDGLTGYLYTIMHLYVCSCLFHTLKEILIDSSTAYIVNCHETANVTTANTVSTCRVISDGSVHCNSIFAIKRGGYGNTYNNSGVITSTITNLREYLEIQANDDVRGMRVYKAVYRPNTNYNSSVSDLATHGMSSRMSFEMYPSIGIQDVIQPLRLKYDNFTNLANVEISSGNSKRYASSDYAYAMQLLDSNDGIPLYEFLRRWDAGTAYTGKVKHLFSEEITATPSTGLITNSSGTVIGIGKKAISDNTYPKSVTRYIDVDTLVGVRYSYSYPKLECDLVQGARKYSENDPSVDGANGRKRQYICTTSVRDTYVFPRINAIIYNTTTSRYEIYNGFEWVALTSRVQRYEYSDKGKSISERATMADFVGQTFYNNATGITYTFWMPDDLSTYEWRTSIGNVTSLDNPNGYNATSNPVAYATELTSGECVICAGVLYKWNGNSFDAI